jgi:hypothetical protein
MKYSRKIMYRKIMHSEWRRIKDRYFDNVCGFDNSEIGFGRFLILPQSTN